MQVRKEAPGNCRNAGMQECRLGRKPQEAAGSCRKLQECRNAGQEGSPRKPQKTLGSDARARSTCEQREAPGSPMRKVRAV